MRTHGITLHQEILGLDEIQAEDSKIIAAKKAATAFTIIGKPLFVNDACWHIPALGGFPGPFMKYVVKWLTEEDILNLMRNKTDRRIVLTDTIAYTDGSEEQLFVRNVKGTILATPQGDANEPFISRLISFADNGESLATVRSSGFTERELPLWNKFAEWLKTQ